MSSNQDFQRVVDLYYAALYRFAFSLTRRESDACDLTQETYYIFAEKGHQIQDPSKLKSWLFTTLHREFLRKFKRISKFPETEIESVAAELPTVVAGNNYSVDVPQLLNALGTIDPAFQAPVSLFYLEDYTYPEIADILGIPLGTVKSRIARGVGQLQKLLLSRDETGKGAA